jgi:GAF domain-containing protein
VERPKIDEVIAALRSQGQMSVDGARHPADMADALLEMLIDAEGTESFLAEVARAAVGAIPIVVTCGISVARTEWSRLLGATSDDLSQRMDASQYEVDDGPCLTALRKGVTVHVDDIAADGRWPEFSRQGRQEGLGASLSVPMTVRGRSVGALNLYACGAYTLSADDSAQAHRFANRATGAVAIGLLLADREEHAHSLETALRSRSVIDKAIGIIMVTGGLDETGAFDVLRQRSQHTHIKLREVAAHVVAESTGDQPG